MRPNQELVDLRDALAELERAEEHYFQTAKRAYEHLACSRRRLAVLKKKIKAVEARERARRQNIPWKSAITLNPTDRP